MQVLFLAVGATRRRAVTGESAAVVADGGRAIVVIDQARSWARDSFDARVEIVELAGLEQRHPSRSVERLLLFAAPRRVFRAIRRGRLANWSRRAEKAFERRVAARIQRAVAPVNRRLWGDVRQRLIQDQISRGSDIDLVVVSDPTSMPYAARLVRGSTSGRVAALPRVSYSYDYIGEAGAGSPRRSTDAVRGED